MTMPEITMQSVARWLDKLRALDGDARLASATQRHIFDILSRFLAWGVERGHVETNACRMIPPTSKVRPAYTPENHRTWIQNPDLARAIFCALPEPIDLIFLIGYTSGLRPGEKLRSTLERLCMARSRAARRSRLARALQPPRAAQSRQGDVGRTEGQVGADQR